MDREPSHKAHRQLSAPSPHPMPSPDAERSSLPSGSTSQWFAEHVHRHEPMLRAWLRQRFETQLDLDDILQETYLRVLQAHASGPLASPKAFLFATARNLALDRLRRHEVARTDSMGEIDTLHVLDEGAGIPETLARSQEIALLIQAIQSLPARCRQILTLRKLYGLSHAEIAARLGLSASTVSNQITIGIEKCTAFFAEHGDGAGNSR